MTDISVYDKIHNKGYVSDFTANGIHYSYALMHLMNGKKQRTHIKRGQRSL